MPTAPCVVVHTFVSPRLSSRVRIDCRALLRRFIAACISTTTPWQRSNQPRTHDGSVAQNPRARDREARRWHLRATMRWGSERYAQLIKVCRARGCSREDASDLVQEAHLRLFEYLRSAKVKDVNALLRRIVINLSINIYHRERSSPLVSESLGRLDRRGLLIDPAAGPERALAAEQQLDRVVGLLSAVSPRSCQIFIAQRGGYTYEEIGSAYAIKPRTVEKHVTSAMLALKEMMPAEFAIP